MHLLLLALSSFNVGVSFKVLPSFGTPSRSTSGLEDTRYDLADLIQPLSIQQAHVYHDSLSILDKIQASPSCHRLAASSLLNACQSIDVPQKQVEDSMQDIRSHYAAQLATCEITSAGSTVPHHCRSLIPSTSTMTSQIPRASGDKFPLLSSHQKQQLSQCLKTLESRPQWWTSYSNNIQNAATMCQAARADIEKDDMIELFKTLVNTNWNAHQSMSSALDMFDAAISGYRQFASSLKSFQERLLVDLQRSGEQAESTLAGLVTSLGKRVRDLADSISSPLKLILSDVNGLGEHVRKANDDVSDLQRTLETVYRGIIENSSSVATAYHKQLVESGDAVSALQARFADRQEAQTMEIMGSFAQMNMRLQMTSDLISRMHVKHYDIDQRLDTLAATFDTLESKSRYLHDTQNDQIQSQRRLYDQMEMDMYVTKAVLGDVHSAVESLRTTIESTSNTVTKINTAGSFTGSLIQWGWLSLILSAVYQFSAPLAKLAVTSIAATLLFKVSFYPWLMSIVKTDIMLIHYASGVKIPLDSIIFGTALLSVPCLAMVFYRLYSRRFQVCSRFFRLASEFPSAMKLPDHHFSDRPYDIDDRIRSIYDETHLI